MRGHPGLRPWLAGLARDAGSPEQFQFGVRLVRLDGFEGEAEGIDPDFVLDEITKTVREAR